VRSRRLDDRGGSAVEAALLMAAVALVMLPALFLLGRAVDAAFNKPCDAEELSGADACAAARGGGGGGGAAGSGGSGSGSGSGNEAEAARVATRNLETWLAGELPVPPSGGSPTVVCQDLASASPPAGTKTSCDATFPNQPTQTHVVEWGADGNPRVIT
jgi:Flp pilus assembly pilin Flp